MPITLTTPIQTGALDPEGPYEEVKILEFTPNAVNKTIVILCQYGNTVNGEWVPGIKAGIVADQGFIVRDEGEGTDYTIMAAKLIVADDVGKSFYDRISGILYQWLLDKGHYVGTIT
jgi:hypothetical protein